MNSLYKPYKRFNENDKRIKDEHKILYELEGKYIRLVA